MKITFDPAKNARNVRERGISFELAADFEFETAIYVEDIREDYGEVRVRAFGFIGRRLHVLVFTMRGAVLRVIIEKGQQERGEMVWRRNGPILK